MCFLLTPTGTKDARRLPDYLSDLLTKNFVVMAVIIIIIIDALDADICTQVNWITDTTVCPAEGDLKGHFAISQQDSRKARARIREGQLGRPRYDILYSSDRPTELVRHLHGMGLGAQFRRQYVA
jgi:hypothetical protein